MGIVKSVSENEVVLSTGKLEYVIPLSPEEAKGLHQVLLNNEFVLIPFNEYDKRQVEANIFAHVRSVAIILQYSACGRRESLRDTVEALPYGSVPALP